MLNIADLENKAKEKSGLKSKSAKKGMDFLFQSNIPIIKDETSTLSTTEVEIISNDLNTKFSPKVTNQETPLSPQKPTNTDFLEKIESQAYASETKPFPETSKKISKKQTPSTGQANLIKKTQINNKADPLHDYDTRSIFKIANKLTNNELNFLVALIEGGHKTENNEIILNTQTLVSYGIQHNRIRQARIGLEAKGLIKSEWKTDHSHPKKANRFYYRLNF